MNLDTTTYSPFLDALITWWTPIFLGFFAAVLFYALRPRNRATFDAAAKMPLRED